jgi:hypothetical protein
MINITKKQIDDALPQIEEGLINYVSLQEKLQNVDDVSTNRDFQKQFNHFYRVRRNTVWQSHFFKLLQEKRNSEVSFADALGYIKEKTGRLEASFVSKLVATIHTNTPVIDRFVLKNANLKLPYFYEKDRESKILSVYNDLYKKIKDFIKTDNGKYLVNQFQSKYPEYKITETKMVDLILWKIR